MDLTLDPATTALVLIDLQRSNVARQLAPHPAADVVRNCAQLADRLRAAGALVVFVRVLVAELLDLPVDAPFPKPPGGPPPEAADLVPEAGVRPGDLVVTKRHWGAFHGTELDQMLRRRGIRTIVLGGIATNFGIESTARAAFDRGYELVFVEDAMSSIAAEAHEHSVRHHFTRMGRVRRADQVGVAADGR